MAAHRNIDCTLPKNKKKRATHLQQPLRDIRPEANARTLPPPPSVRDSGDLNGSSIIVIDGYGLSAWHEPARLYLFLLRKKI